MNSPSFNFLQPESIFVELDTNFVSEDVVDYDYKSYRNTIITGCVTNFFNTSISSLTSLILPDHIVGKDAMFNHMHNWYGCGSTLFENIKPFPYLDNNVFTSFRKRELNPFGYAYEYNLTASVSLSSVLIQIPLPKEYSISSISLLALSGTDYAEIYIENLTEQDYNLYRGWNVYSSITSDFREPIGRATKDGLIWLYSTENAEHLKTFFSSNPNSIQIVITADIVKNSTNINIPIKIGRNNLNGSTNHSWVSNILNHTINNVNPRVYFTHMIFFDEDKIPMGIVKFPYPIQKNRYTELNYNIGVDMDTLKELTITSISSSTSGESITGGSTSAVPAESDLLYDLRNTEGYIELFDTETDKVKTWKSINPDINMISSTTGNVFFDTPPSPELVSFKISDSSSDNFAGYPSMISDERSYEEYGTTYYFHPAIQTISLSGSSAPNRTGMTMACVFKPKDVVITNNYPADETIMSYAGISYGLSAGEPLSVIHYEVTNPEFSPGSHATYPAMGINYPRTFGTRQDGFQVEYKKISAYVLIFTNAGYLQDFHIEIELDASLVDGEWHSMLARYSIDTNILDVYLDGQSLTSVVCSKIAWPRALPYPIRAATFGGYSGYKWTVGFYEGLSRGYASSNRAFDQAWDKALTDEEIQQYFEFVDYYKNIT